MLLISYNYLILATVPFIKTFRNKAANIESLKSTFLACVDEINELNYKIASDMTKYTPSFQGVETVYDMYGYIQRRISDINRATEAAATKAAIPPPTEAGDGTPGQSGQGQPNTIQAKVKLPCLELKSFSGDPTEWPLWYESYKTLIH